MTSFIINGLAVVGAFVALLWLAAAAGIGDFQLTYGPSGTSGKRGKSSDEPVSPAVKASERPVYVLVQEGGSSSELYLHAWETREDAEQDRIDCARNGSYRTSAVIEVPGALARQASFYDVVEEILRAAVHLEYVDTEEAA